MAKSNITVTVNTPAIKYILAIQIIILLIVLFK